MTITYTANLHLAKPDFRSPDWADQLNNNADAIDAAIRNVLMNVVPWVNSTSAGIGQVFLDTVTGAFWICGVSHTTVVAPGTFAQERAANPTFWTSFSFGIKVRGAWTNNTTYNVNDVAYDSVRGITGVAHTANVSNATGSILDDASNWDFIVNLPTVFTARATSYDNSVSHLAAIDVQDAIDAVDAAVQGAYVSGNVAFTPGASGLTSTTVQDAIVETKTDIDTNSAAIVAANAAIASGILSTGFPHWRPTAEILTGHIPANGLTLGDASSGATNRADADTAALYAWHWNNFSNTQCPVSTGRGANAAADFAAHKTITVLDMKGTGNIGIDTMGGATSTRLGSVPATSGNSTTPGSILGENLHTLSAAEQASMSVSVSVSVSGSTTTLVGVNTFGGSGSSNAYVPNGNGNQGNDFNSGGSFSGSGSGSGTASGSGGAHNTVMRVMTGYWYLKL